MTRSRLASFSFLLVLLVSLSSCDAIAGIFKAGIWTGLLLVVVVIALVIWIITRFRK
jgi:hypothetical protein